MMKLNIYKVYKKDLDYKKKEWNQYLVEPFAFKTS